MAAVVTAGCADEMTEPSRDISVRIEQGSALEMVLDDTVRLSASVLDGQGRSVPGAVVRWTSADPWVATVYASGLVTAVGVGSTTVTATVASGASAVVVVTVGLNRKAIADERAALTALYEATGGPNWVNSEGWLTTAPVGNWYGVGTGRDGRVVYLSLWDNGLTGEIPPELVNLANLERLVLRDNNLTGGIPAELSSLGVLEIFYWQDNAGLCAPGTRQFIDFAAGIHDHRGPFCHESDAAVLESLYSSAGGSSWNSSDGWLQPGPLSDWYGVETDSVAGRVVGLDLSENGLSGPLPASLSSMEVLRELRVDGNSQLGGRLPLGMTTLTLRMLRYDGTNVCAPAKLSFRGWLQYSVAHGQRNRMPTANGPRSP